MPREKKANKFKEFFSSKPPSKSKIADDSETQRDDNSELDPVQLQTGSELQKPHLTPREERRRSYWPGASPKSQQAERSAGTSEQELVIYRGSQGGAVPVQETTATDQLRTLDGHTLQLSVRKPLPEVPQPETLVSFSDPLELGIQCPDSPRSVHSQDHFKPDHSFAGRSQAIKLLPALQYPHFSGHSQSFDLPGNPRPQLPGRSQTSEDLEPPSADQFSKPRRLSESQCRELGSGKKLKAKLDEAESFIRDQKIELKNRDRRIQDLSRLCDERMVSERSHYRKIDKLREQHGEELARIEERHKQQLSDREQEHYDSFSAQLRENNNANDRKISKLKTDHENQLSTLEYEKDRLSTEHEQQKAQFEDEIVAKAQQQVDRLAAMHKESLKRMDEQMQALKDAHAEEVEKLKEALRDELKDHKEEIVELHKKHEKESDGLKKKMEELVARHTQEKKDLAQRQFQQTAGLRDSVRELKDALLASDASIGSVFTVDLPKNPDEQIRDQLSQLKERVEELSRLGWRQDRKIWPDAVIEKVGSQHGVRVTKQAIMQDMIWSLLFRFVFCSPFRMFGEEGRKLEQEWYERCEKDTSSKEKLYVWPLPGIKAERWRYMTMKECREVILEAQEPSETPEPSELDARIRIFSGFKNCLNRLVSELISSLGEVVKLNPPQVQAVQRLSADALKLWLDFCMYRCRMRILLKGPIVKPTPKEIASSQSGAWELNVTPEVGRHGNIEGIELETFTTLKGWAGESLLIP